MQVKTPLILHQRFYPPKQHVAYIRKFYIYYFHISFIIWNFCRNNCRGLLLWVERVERIMHNKQPTTWWVSERVMTIMIRLRVYCFLVSTICKWIFFPASFHFFPSHSSLSLVSLSLTVDFSSPQTNVLWVSKIFIFSEAFFSSWWLYWWRERGEKKEQNVKPHILGWKKTEISSLSNTQQPLQPMKSF